MDAEFFRNTELLRGRIPHSIKFNARYFDTLLSTGPAYNFSRTCMIIIEMWKLMIIMIMIMGHGRAY